MLEILYLHSAPGVLSYKSSWLRAFLLKWAGDHKRREFPKPWIDCFVDSVSSKFKQVILFDVIQVNLSCSCYFSVEFFFYLSNFVFCVLIGLGDYRNEIKQKWKFFHDVNVGLFDSRTSQKIETAVNPSVLIRSLLVDFPLSSCILLDLPQVFVLFIGCETWHIHKVHRVSFVKQVLVTHPHLISNLFSSRFDERLINSSLLSFKASNEGGLSSVLCSCDQNIQNFLLQVFSSLGFISLRLFRLLLSEFFARSWFLDFLLGMTILTWFKGLTSVAFFFTTQFHTLDFLAIKVSALFIDDVDLDFGLRTVLFLNTLSFKTLIFGLSLLFFLGMGDWVIVLRQKLLTFRYAMFLR